MPFSSDRDLARAVGLSDLVLQDFLRKTRQAIHAGMNDHAVSYFKPSELKAIHLHVMQHARHELANFREYVTSTRKKDAESILSMEGFFDNPVVDSRTEEIFVVLPDFLYLRHENKIAADYLLTVKTHKSTPSIFFVADPREANALTKALEEKERHDTVLVQGEAGVFPYMMFCIGANRRLLKGYVLSDMFFREMPGLRADQVFEHVLGWYEAPRAKPKPAVRKKKG